MKRSSKMSMNQSMKQRFTLKWNKCLKDTIQFIQIQNLEPILAGKLPDIRTEKRF